MIIPVGDSYSLAGELSMRIQNLCRNIKKLQTSLKFGTVQSLARFEVEILSTKNTPLHWAKTTIHAKKSLQTHFNFFISAPMPAMFKEKKGKPKGVAAR